MSLKLEHINKSYGANLILDDISFTIDKGELVGLLGPNGAGKSTTFKVLTGLTRCDSGLIRWKDKIIDTESIEWKRKLGYLAEHNPLYPHMYVEQFLRYISKIYDIENASTRINEVIGLVELQEYRKFRISKLSKGYRQRVGIAQAIIHNPEILILDEPTSGLDPNQLIEIRQLIKSLAKDRIVILSSHILKEVDEICSRILLIKNGEIVLDRVHGTKSNEAKLKLKVVFDKDFQIAWFKSVGKAKRNKDNEMIIQLHSNEQRGDIFDIAVLNKLKILEMASVSNRLEEEFVALTN